MKRIEYLDAAKGALMICIVAGHFINNPVVHNSIFSFHVPAFFIISGYFYKNTGREKVKSYCIRCLKPYSFTVLVLLLVDSVANVMRLMLQKNYVNEFEIIKKWLIAFLYGSGSRNVFLGLELPVVGAVWFLLALSWSVVLFVLIEHLIARFRVQNTSIYAFVISIILFVIALYSATWAWFPFSIQAGMAGVLFFYVGHLFKRNYGTFRFSLYISSICLLVWCVDIYFNIRNDYMSLVRCCFPNPVINILGAISGTYIIVCVMYGLEKVKVLTPAFRFLTEWGKYSTVILCFHLVELDFFPWNRLFYFLNSHIIKTCIILFCKIVFCTICMKIIKRIKKLNLVFS